jgi:hypothetical protein
VVGASPRELVCFWTPFDHEQPHLLMQSLLTVASQRGFPLIWATTEDETVQPPADFQEVDLASLGQALEPGRYVVKLNIYSLSAVEAETVASTLVTVAARQRIPVWMGIHGQMMEPGCWLVQHAHRVKILAALGVAKRGFWKTQSDLLKQSVNVPAEWLAVNDVPWYRW